MSKIPSITEQELLALNPCALDQTFLSRLTACAEETYAGLSDEETAFESELRAIRPRDVQASFLETLHSSIADVPFAVDEKIVLFNKSNQSSRSAAKTGGRSNIFRFNIAAAAAVALLGSLAALMMPGNANLDAPSASTSTENETIPAFVSPTPPNIAPVTNIAPAGYNRTLVGTSDEGVIWQSDTKPFRVLRHTFNDSFTTEGEHGESIQKEQPHVEYSLIPEKVD